MSIATEIERLQQAKADIKSAIEAKGVTVPSSALLDAYDTYVAQISGGGGGGLPAGATAYDYVEADGTQWIDTGVGNGKSISAVDIFTFWAFTSGNPNYSWIFFGAISSNQYIGCQCINNANSNFRCHTPSIQSNLTGNMVKKFTQIKSGVMTIYQNTYTMGTGTYTGNLSFFAPYVDTTTKAKGRMWRTQIKIDGTLVRDFQPCTDPNGRAAMYDLVSGQYFYGNNASGNNLSAGNE